MAGELKRKCSGCHKEKDKKSFAKGKFDICTTCYKKQWNENNPDKLRPIDYMAMLPKGQKQ